MNTSISRTRIDCAERPRSTVPTHPLVRELWRVIKQKHLSGKPTSMELLDLFWDQVEAQGTPLLHDVDGTTRATFVYPESIDDLIDREMAYHKVTVAWGDAWTACFDTSFLDLTRIPRSNVWWAEVDVPAHFTGIYYFEMHNRHGLITEDVHEPWAMSFCDPYNPWSIGDLDSVYPRGVVTTKEHRGFAREGTVEVRHVATDLLELPARRSASVNAPRKPFPVWTYTPHPAWSVRSEDLPLVVAMAGQFHESLNLERELDHAIADRVLPPVRVWTPGEYTSGFNAWEYRHGRGPDELSSFFTGTLLASEGDAPVHLVGWAYTTYSAVETATRLPGDVASIILLDPAPSRPGGRFWNDNDWDIEIAFTALAKSHPGLVVAISESPDRGESGFAWRYPYAEQFANAAERAGLDVRRFEVSDPNMVATVEAIPAGIACAIAESP